MAREVKLTVHYKGADRNSHSFDYGPTLYFLNIDGLASYHLLNLSKEGKVRKAKDTNPMIWWRPEEKLMSKEEKILDLLGKEHLAALDISNKLNLNWKYTFYLLNKLKNKNLVLYSKSHPRVWRTT